jgi:hypothetical protein
LRAVCSLKLLAYAALSYYIQVFCFALNAGDGSSIRSQIEHAAQHFVDLTPLLAVSLVTAAEVLLVYEALSY